MYDQSRVTTIYFFICLTALVASCQEVLHNNLSTHQESSTRPVHYLDSLADPLFSHLVRDSLFENPYGFAPNEIVTYADSVYAERVCQIPSGVPLVYDENVQDYINLYAMRKKDLTERMIGKSSWYYPAIEKMLAQEQMPDVLKHLTMIESAMQIKAASHKSAVGLWQIRPATGISLGLEVSPWVDQRRDPVYATRAAIRYLKELYDRYHDWYLAIAAYNYGIGNIDKAIARATAEEERVPQDFWELREYLPLETRSYIPAFVAVVYLYNFQQEHNLRPACFNLPFGQVDSLRVESPSSLEAVSETTGVGVDVLHFLNPSFLRGVLPLQEEDYRLALPVDYDTLLVAHQPLMSPPRIDSTCIRQTAQIIHRPIRVVPNPEEMMPLAHYINKGNTLASIAAQYGCTVDDLVNWNSLYESTIRYGDELTVYVPRQGYEEATLVRR